MICVYFSVCFSRFSPALRVYLSFLSLPSFWPSIHSFIVCPSFILLTFALFNSRSCKWPFPFFFFILPSPFHSFTSNIFYTFRSSSTQLLSLNRESGKERERNESSVLRVLFCHPLFHSLLVLLPINFFSILCYILRTFSSYLSVSPFQCPLHSSILTRGYLRGRQPSHVIRTLVFSFPLLLCLSPLCI